MSAAALSGLDIRGWIFLSLPPVSLAAVILAVMLGGWLTLAPVLGLPAAVFQTTAVLLGAAVALVAGLWWWQRPPRR